MNWLDFNIGGDQAYIRDLGATHDVNGVSHTTKAGLPSREASGHTDGPDAKFTVQPPFGR